MAKFTNHQCDQFVAFQIQGSDGQGFQHLVDRCQHSNHQSVWEPALATLVNLSFIGKYKRHAFKKNISPFFRDWHDLIEKDQIVIEDQIMI